MKNIKINGKKKEISDGVIAASKLYEACTTSSEEVLCLNISDESIFIDKNDHVLVADEMNFVTKTSTETPENPILKKPLSIKVNEESHELTQNKNYP